jgi:hypothetical protein
MFKPTVPESQPVVAYLEASNVEILYEDRSQSGAVVFSLKMPSGAYRTLTINYEFLQNTFADQIEKYLNSYNFFRKLEGENQHIAKPLRS